MSEINEKNGKEVNIVNDAIIKNLRDMVATLNYGSITLKIHNANIVSLEVTEKKRFDDVWFVEKGGGI